MLACKNRTPECLLFYCCDKCSRSFRDLEGNVKCGIGLGKEDGGARCNEECEARNLERLHVEVTGGKL